ncbi:MAG: glycosyltransferase family 2 protein [Syntrophothermus sp.]
MKATVIIPAYNEEKRIARVIHTALETPGVENVIVIDDGSSDHTARVARHAGAQVISLPTNLGKGGAMRAGAVATTSEFLVFLDADLVGLTQDHIRSLLEPVVDGKADMTIGLFGEGRRSTDLAQKITPFLTGQRAMRREMFLGIPGIEDARFGVEMVLTRYAKENNLRVQDVRLPGMTQVMKEEKRGFVKGFQARMKMYWEVLKSLR